MLFGMETWVGLLEWLPHTSQTTVTFCRTLFVAHCAPTPMTCGSCLCREHITNSVIGVSRPPVLDCGTTFHLDYGGRDLPSTPSDNLWKLTYLATEALSDFWIDSHYINKLIYLSVCWMVVHISALDVIPTVIPLGLAPTTVNSPIVFLIW